VYLERAARMQLRATAAFGPLTAVDSALASEAHDYLLKPAIVEATFSYWCRQTHMAIPTPFYRQGPADATA
jgi:L-fuculose-phosphate aldolase